MFTLEANLILILAPVIYINPVKSVTFQSFFGNFSKKLPICNTIIIVTSKITENQKLVFYWLEWQTRIRRSGRRDEPIF